MCIKDGLSARGYSRERNSDGGEVARSCARLFLVQSGAIGETALLKALESTCDRATNLL